jgi:carbon starvation protein
VEASLAAGTAANPAVTKSLIFNARLDAVVCGVFIVLVAVIMIDSALVWIGILRGTRDARVREAPFTQTQLQAEEL